MQVTTKLCELWHPVYSYFMVHLDLLACAGGGMHGALLPASQHWQLKTCWRVKLHGDTSKLHGAPNKSQQKNGASLVVLVAQ